MLSCNILTVSDGVSFPHYAKAKADFAFINLYSCHGLSIQRTCYYDIVAGTVVLAGRQGRFRWC